MTALTLPPTSATTPARTAGARTSLANCRSMQFDLPPGSMRRPNTLQRATEAISYDAAGVLSPYRLFL